jgi:acyl carrier protein
MPPPDLDERLSAIFRAAFNGLQGESVRRATRETVGNWDSIAAVRLAALIEEEFGHAFDLEEAAEWTSYEQVRSAIAKRLAVYPYA